jgi:hypothetical protein
MSSTKNYFENISSVEIDVVPCGFGNLIPGVDNMEREQREQRCPSCCNKVTHSFANKLSINGCHSERGMQVLSWKQDTFYQCLFTI